MALKKIRFVWPTPAIPEGRWRGGLFHIAQAIDSTRPMPTGGVPAYWKGYLHHTITLSVRGLLVWGTVFAIIGYFSAAGFLFVRYERANPHNRVGYWDLALPTRWSERPRLQGEGFILLAKDKVEEGRFQEGFSLLRLGVERAPANSDARLDLARIYLAIRLRPQAEKLLRDGLAYGYPGRAYLDVMLTLAAEGDQPDAWLELCQLASASLTATPSAPPEDRLWLDRQTVRAHTSVGGSAAAAAYLATRYPEKDPLRREITLLTLFDEKKPAETVAFATRWAEEAPRSPEPLRLLIRAQREAGDLAAMDATLARLRALDPTKPDALLYAVAQNHYAGRPDAVRAARDEVIFRHGARVSVLTALAAIYADLGLRDEVSNVEREMRERGMPTASALIYGIQADIAARDWAAALATADKLRARDAGRLSEIQLSWLETMRRLALACADAGSGNQSSLAEIVADQPGTLRLYNLILHSLLDAGRIDTAAQVLALAEGPYPAARSLAALRDRIETAQATQLASRPAPAPVAAPDGDPLAGLDAFTAAFNTRIQNQDTPGALSLLAAARRAQPAWLVGQEPRLDALELPLRAQGDDPLRLQLLVRNTLGRDASAPAALLALARATHAGGQKGNAVLIAKEILRRDPSHAETLAQLGTWEPRKADGTLDVMP